VWLRFHFLCSDVARPTEITIPLMFGWLWWTDNRRVTAAYDDRKAPGYGCAAGWTTESTIFGENEIGDNARSGTGGFKIPVGFSVADRALRRTRVTVKTVSLGRNVSISARYSGHESVRVNPFGPGQFAKILLGTPPPIAAPPARACQ
jgi:hypothetical protein